MQQASVDLGGSTPALANEAHEGRPAGWNDAWITWRIDPEGAETRALAELVSLRDLRVLELGCGNGRLTFLYAGSARSVLAIDPDAERIDEARRSLPAELSQTVTFAVASAEKIDAPHRSFDLALFSSSL